MPTHLWIIKFNDQEPIITHDEPAGLPPEGSYPEAVFPEGLPTSVVMPLINQTIQTVVPMRTADPALPIIIKFTMSDLPLAVQLE